MGARCMLFDELLFSGVGLEIRESEGGSDVCIVLECQDDIRGREIGGSSAGCECEVG